MVRSASDLPGVQVVVVIEEPDSSHTFDDWLRSTASDQPITADLRAAQLIRELREHGEL